VSERATSFGSDAERYDRARPSYPPELIDDLVTESPRRVLDVGCGTGKASALFAARGCDVLGVEPDARMAEVARSHGIAVEVSRFEDWNPHGRTFDLVVAAQAWHWVDHGRALPKVASVLRSGARFAAFWNRAELDESTRAAIDAVYEAIAPELATEAAARAERDHSHMHAIAESGLFEHAETWTYERLERYATSEWVELLRTQSDHILLPDEQKARLLDAVAAGLDRLGGGLALRYRTIALTALRAG
jgi:trans-aconitate methyltransferase